MIYRSGAQKNGSFLTAKITKIHFPTGTKLEDLPTTTASDGCSTAGCRFLRDEHGVQPIVLGLHLENSYAILLEYS